jgi:hypothetical protein
MTIEYVQFTDATQATVCSVFLCPQDPVAHPNQGEIDSQDPRVLAFLNPPPAPLTVTSYQLRTALNQLSLRAAVETAVAAASQQIKDAWQYQQAFTETDSMVQQIATAIQEVSDIPTVFTLASTLQP